MKYNYRTIGKRISEGRKTCGLSQNGLIDLLKTEYSIAISRNTLSRLEGGYEVHVDIELLFALADVFNVEVAYLVGEIDLPTGRETDIAAETGLSANSVRKLLLLHHCKDNLIIETIDKLLNTVTPVPSSFGNNMVVGIDDLLRLIGMYLDDSKHLSIDKDFSIKSSRSGGSVRFDSSAFAEGALIHLIEIKLTEYRMDLLRKQKRKTR